MKLDERAFLPDNFWNTAEKGTCEYLDASSHFSYLQDPRENSKLNRWLRGLGLGGIGFYK